MELTVHTDGGSRGNPGQAAVGVVMQSEIVNRKPSTVIKFGKRIGIKTNNEAEYYAVISALQEAKERLTVYGLRFTKISVYLDSLLVCEQLNGRYKVKQAHLQVLLLQVRQLEQEIGIPVTYRHIPREENKAADKLVNHALDTP